MIMPEVAGMVGFALGVALSAVIISISARRWEKRYAEWTEKSLTNSAEELKANAGYGTVECYSTRVYRFIDKDGDAGFGLYVTNEEGELEFQELYPPIYEEDEESNSKEEESEESE